MVDDFKDKSVPFTRYDLGWVVLCIGMAIGGAMIFMPVQVGMTGLWVFLVSVAIAYPGVYFFQKLYLESLTKTESTEDYTDIIGQYLGKDWAAFLGVLYLLLMLTGMLSYSTGLTNDSAKYLFDFNVTSVNLAQTTWWWALILMVFMVSIASQGEKLLFKISGPLVVGKVGIIVLLAMVMIPHWDFANIKPMESLPNFLRDVVITIPFSVFSIVFMPILSPMNVAYCKEFSDKREAVYRAFRASRIAFIVLAIIVLFFAVSFTLSLSYEEAVQAYKENVSALTIASKVLPGTAIKIMTPALNIFALVTAFFALYLALHEALQGLIFNFLSRMIPEEKINKTILHYVVVLIIVLGLWGWVLLDAKALIILHLSAPLFGIIACFIPAYLIYKVPSLHHLKGFKMYYGILFGIILLVSPLFRFLE